MCDEALKILEENFEVTYNTLGREFTQAELEEEAEGKVSVRSRYLGDEGMKDLSVFIDDICKEIRTKEIRKIEVQENK